MVDNSNFKSTFQFSQIVCNMTQTVEKNSLYMQLSVLQNEYHHKQLQII